MSTSTSKTSGSARLVGLWRRLPRSGKWLAAFAVGLLAYFAAIEPVVEWTVQASSRADAMEARLAAVRSMAERADEDRQTIALGARLHGEVALPGPRAERATALNRAVDGVLRQANVQGARTQTTEQNLPDGPATRHYGGRGSLVRLVSTVSFEASPEAFAQVLSGLENHPDVAAVTRVIVRRADDGSRRVSATVTVEAWALGSGATRSGPVAVGTGGGDA